MHCSLAEQAYEQCQTVKNSNLKKKYIIFNVQRNKLCIHPNAHLFSFVKSLHSHQNSISLRERERDEKNPKWKQSVYFLLINEAINSSQLKAQIIYDGKSNLKTQIIIVTDKSKNQSSSKSQIFFFPPSLLSHILICFCLSSLSCKPPSHLHSFKKNLEKKKRKYRSKKEESKDHTFQIKAWIGLD